MAGLAATLGSGSMTNSIPEIGAISDVIFVIGSNTAECHPLIAAQVIKAQERGAKLIVADPRRTDMANKADLFIRVPTGHNIPLLNAMMHVIVKEGLHKPDFIAAHANGFDELAEAVAFYSPEVVEEMSGIPATEIFQAARMFGRAKAAVTLYAMGITQFTHGTANVVSLSNLSVITGQIGRPGAGLCPLRGQNNVQGSCDMGALPNVYPAYKAVADEGNALRYEDAWGVKLSRKVGLKVTEVPHAIEHGQARALIVFGENPMMSDPDLDALRHEVAELELMITLDMFMTETARRADVVFPTAGWPEKDGTFSNTERRVQRVRVAVAPHHGNESDWWVFSQLAKRMGYDGMSYASAEEVWDELRRIEPAAFGGISYARLDQVPGIPWPCPDESHPGTPVLHLNGNFVSPSGKAELYPVYFHPDTLPTPTPKDKGKRKTYLGCIGEPSNAEYPFALNTGRIVTHYHTGTMTRKSEVLDMLASEEKIELNPEDAEELGVRTGDLIKVETKRGHIVARAWVTGRILPKNIFGTFHFWEACANELTSADKWDPIAGIPEFKISAAKVTKCSPEDAKEWRRYIVKTTQD